MLNEMLLANITNNYDPYNFLKSHLVQYSSFLSDPASSTISRISRCIPHLGQNMKGMMLANKSSLIILSENNSQFFNL